MYTYLNIFYSIIVTRGQQSKYSVDYTQSINRTWVRLQEDIIVDIGPVICNQQPAILLQ